MGKSFNPVHWIFYILLMMIPEALTCKSFPWWDAPVSLIFNVIAYGTLFWLILLLTSMSSRRIQIAIHAFLHVFVLAYAIITVFLVIKFHRHVDVYILQFVKETNVREATEFISNYILSPATLFLLVGGIAIVWVELLLCKKVRDIPVFPHNRWLRIAVILLAIGMLSNVFFFLSDAETNYERAAGMPIKRNAFWTLHQSLLQYGEFKKEYNECAKTLSDYHEKVEQSRDDADFVLIIGESFNKHVSNLYDSPYNTNPLLSKYKKSGDIVVFDDVIASSNGTTENFKAFMSMASINDKVRWSSVPLFPALLRHAGYNVIFFSNQFVRNDNLGQFDASMGFFNDPRIEPYLFSHRNTRTFEYDMGLVQDYKNCRSKIESKNRNFCIFHLIGQHTLPSQRFPKGFGSFDSKNVGRKNFTEEENKTFSEYLNATEFNDMVVDSIIQMFRNRNAIVLYLSDHGEEIYNFRNQMGRTDLLTDCKEALHCQLDVPFLIYFTKKYQTTHKDVCERVRHATQRPFMTDDLPHVILDVLSVKSRWFEPKKSLVNDDYRIPTERKILSGRVYEK